MSGLGLAQPDITLHLDALGVIRNVNLGTTISGEKLGDWIGRPWVETVDDLSGSSVRRMLADARAHGVSDFRQIAQRFPSGREIPIEYNAVRLGGKAGLIAVGKNFQGVAELQARLVAAQHAREQDYWKLREVETRYRVLFDSSSEPVLLLRADNLRMLEANPAAMKAWNAAVGGDFLDVVAERDRSPLEAMLSRVREQGRAPGILLHLGAERLAWFSRASLAAGEPSSVFLLQLSPMGPGQPAFADPMASSSDPLVDRLPDAFVLLDDHGVVRRVNRAFLDLIQAGVAALVIGEPFGRWLSHPGADASVLMENVSRRGVLRHFATTIYGELGLKAEVEISAAADGDTRPRNFAVLVRDVSRRFPRAKPTDELGAVFGGLTERIGKVPLLQLVKETGSLIERHYIEEALEQAAGNRTAAAELLGLSRQSLYAKLGRYGLDGGPPTAETVD